MRDGAGQVGGDLPKQEGGSLSKMPELMGKGTIEKLV